MNRLDEIELEIKRLNNEVEIKLNKNYKSLESYQKALKSEYEALNRLDREKRMIMPPSFSDLGDNEDLMTVEQFKAGVKYGGYMDCDGHGYYVHDGKCTGIRIHPSDVEHNCIREEFTTIAWYSR